MFEWYSTAPPERTTCARGSSSLPPFDQRPGRLHRHAIDETASSAPRRSLRHLTQRRNCVLQPTMKHSKALVAMA